MKFVNAANQHYRIIVEEHGLLWRITVGAPGRTDLRFTNIYDSVDAALTEAERLADCVLAKWGVVLDGPIRWESGAAPHVSSNRAIVE